MSYARLYSFRNIVEPAVKAVLAKLDVRAFTTQDEFDFQIARPRVELSFLCGAGLGRFVIIDPATSLPIAAGSTLNPREAFNYRRESAWSGHLKATVVTEANPARHEDFCAKVFWAFSNIWTQINGEALTRHQLSFDSDGGISQAWKSEDGYYETDMLFNVKLSIQADAWAVLNEQPNAT